MSAEVPRRYQYPILYLSLDKMPNPERPRLSRDELVTIIGDYYKFLVKFYIPESSLKFPPQGGWPSITPETTKGFPRPPMVIDLLKHSPYIDQKHAGDMVTNIHYKCDVTDYSVMTPEQWAEDDQYGVESLQEWIEELEEGRKESPQDEDEDEGYLWYRDEDRDKEADEEENWFDGDDPEDIKLENMVVLANGYESGGRVLILDVFKGNIYEDMIRCSGLQSETPIECYFDDLKSKFERLKFIPIPGDERHEGDLCEDAEPIPEGEEFDESEAVDDEDPRRQYQRIYRSFGWPGENYRKDEAVAAARAYARRLESRDEE